MGLTLGNGNGHAAGRYKLRENKVVTSRGCMRLSGVCDLRLKPAWSSMKLFTSSMQRLDWSRTCPD